MLAKKIGGLDSSFEKNKEKLSTNGLVFAQRPLSPRQGNFESSNGLANIDMRDLINIRQSFLKK